MSPDRADPATAEILALAEKHGLRVAMWDPGKLLDDGPSRLRTNASAMELSQISFAMTADVGVRLAHIEAHIDELTRHLSKNLVTMKPSRS